MASLALTQPPVQPAAAKKRLHYLDWLRVIAIFGVYLVHVTDVFNTINFEIKNAEQSEAITIIQGFFYPWGMPLFFFIAGAGSYFALRHRSAGGFTRERTFRLLIPFLTGTLLLGPLQLYLSWRHRVETGVTNWTFAQFVDERFWQPGPKWFGAIGYHMWFLGFLFAFSLIALPLFMWLRGETGRRAVARLAGICEHRGAILLLALPLVITRLVFQPLFPIEHDWGDFVYYGVFFVLGYVVFSEDRFTQAIRRDWWILLAVLLGTTAGYGVIAVTVGLDLGRAARTVPEFLLWALFAVAGWCGTAFMVFVGMRFLNRTNRALTYSLDVLLPFFVLHQPVILLISYFVVQWDLPLLPKLLVVLVASFAATLGLVEFVVKPVPLLRTLFGMKPAEVEASGAVAMR